MNRLRTRLRAKALVFRKRTTIRSTAEEEERHPLLQQAMDLLVRFGYSLS